MSELNNLIEKIEAKLEALIEKTVVLEQEKLRLENLVAIEIEKNKSLNESLNKLESTYESLRHASSLLGSEDYKRETKLKINTLIREIDHCISQLSK